MSFMKAWLSWNHREALKQQVVSDDKQRFQSALDAEDTLGDIVKDLGHLKHNVHLRKRVYVPEQNRNREIDVIAVCDAIYVVEVKNWTGDVWRNGERWFQMPPRAGARALEFNDVLAECEFKAKALVRFLNRNGIELPAGSVRAVVVFSHPKVRLCPTSLNHPSVLTRESFQQLVGQRSVWRDVATTYVPALFAAKSELTPPMRTAISECLQRVRTWDTVKLHNGEMHTGDVEWLCLVEYTLWKVRNDKVDWLKVKRQHLEVCTVSWAAGGVMGLVEALWKGSAGTLRLQVDPSVTIVSVAESKRPKAKAAATSDVTVPPAVHVVNLTTKSSSKVNTTEVNHIAFRPAGQPGSVTMALSEIAFLDLSPRDV